VKLVAETESARSAGLGSVWRTNRGTQRRDGAATRRSGSRKSVGTAAEQQALGETGCENHRVDGG
jgi:hypothetical protein